ncbi:25665_t:CDS:2, partial [Gigaspora margarita]
MEHYYECRLLGIAHSHPGYIKIAKRFLCPSWDAIDTIKIRPTEISAKYLVPSQKKETELFYIVNMEFCTCTCFIGLSGAPYKHQGAVAAKYNIGCNHANVDANMGMNVNANMDASVGANVNANVDVDCGCKCGYKCECGRNRANVDANAGVNVNANVDTSVGAHVSTNMDTNVNMDVNVVTDVHNRVNMDMNAGVNVDANLDVTANTATDVYNPEFFDTFIKTIKNDYKHCGPQLRAALEKLAERYNAAKAKSILVLTSFLYNVNRNSDPLGRVKSGAKIRVQVESVKRRKTESSVKKSGDKENHDRDLHVISARKIRAIAFQFHHERKYNNAWESFSELEEKYNHVAYEAKFMM